MKCQICGRENASIHIREIKDGEKRSYYICKECAAKKSGSADIMGLAKLIHDLTSSLSKLPVQSPDKKPGNSDQNKKNNGDIPFSGFPQIAEMEMIHDLFGNEPEESMPSDENTGPEKHVEPEKILRCTYCGWGTEQLKKTGRLGCPRCYSVFTEELTGDLKKMHRGSRHAGKYPANLDPELAREVENGREMSLLIREKNKELFRLQNALESAVKQEEYEKAALLRDRIHALLPEMDGGLFGNNSGNTPVSGKRSGGKKEKKAPPEKNL